MIPKIGLIVSIDNELKLNMYGAYGLAIEQSGGLPLVLPYIENEDVIDAFVDVCDGFLFTGGADIEPKHYGEEKHENCWIVEPARDRLEMAVMRKAMRSDKPIFGICRGMQMLNVVMGGALYQDLPSQVKTEIPHRQSEEKDMPSHPILVGKDTPLFALVGKDVMAGNSFHHQGIKRLADGLKVMGRAEDGMIEAVYDPTKKYLRAYQWHPERLYKDSDNKAVFDDFIKACKKR